MLKKKIRIVSTPNGMGVPEWVRKEWVGLEFEAKGPVLKLCFSVKGPFFGITLGRFYAVPTKLALPELKKKSEAAWQWFKDNTFAEKVIRELEAKGKMQRARELRELDDNSIFAFRAKCCVEI